MSTQTQIVLLLVHHNSPSDDAVLAGKGDDFVGETDVGDAFRVSFHVAQVAYMASCGVWSTVSCLKEEKKNIAVQVENVHKLQ